jgi:hypothetical protein
MHFKGATTHIFKYSCQEFSVANFHNRNHQKDLQTSIVTYVTELTFPVSRSCRRRTIGIKSEEGALTCANNANLKNIMYISIIGFFCLYLHIKILDSFENRGGKLPFPETST